MRLHSESKVRILKDAIKNTKLDFVIKNDSSFSYNYENKESGHKSATKYCMYIVRKMETDAKQFSAELPPKHLASIISRLPNTDCFADSTCRYCSDNF